MFGISRANEENNQNVDKINEAQANTNVNKKDDGDPQLQDIVVHMSQNLNWKIPLICHFKRLVLEKN